VLCFICLFSFSNISSSLLLIKYSDGVPIGPVSVALALIASMGGFIFGYDTGQISDMLLMPDFLLRFADCSSGATLETASTECAFTNVRSGLIVALLSIGTLSGALIGAPVADWLGRRVSRLIYSNIYFCLTSL
jgi:SP family sugar:H+ symporter-like MFS transporter